MIFRARMTAAEGLYLAAAALAKLAAKVAGLPVVTLSRMGAVGDSVVELSEPIPRFVRGVRLSGPEMDQICKVERVDGRRVHLDRKLEQVYRCGTAVKVLA